MRRLTPSYVSAGERFGTSMYRNSAQNSPYHATSFLWLVLEGVL
jgi:hypothetical protein